MAPPEPSHRKYARYGGYLIAVIVLLTSGAIAYGGDLYKWVDENGVAHFSDQAPANEGSRYKVTREGLGPQTGDAGAANLYTAETYRKIQKAGEETPLPPRIPGMSSAERYRVVMEREREIYRKVGYDYDTVVRTVARDLRSGRIRLSGATSNVAEAIHGSLLRMRQYGFANGVDCLRFFDAETADAVRYLWGANTGQPLTILPPPLAQAVRPIAQPLNASPPVPQAAQPPKAPPAVQGRSVPRTAAQAAAEAAAQAAESRVGKLKASLDKGDFRTAENILALGVDPNATVYAPGEPQPLLHVYCGAGRIEAVRFLVAHGADVRRKTAKGGTTPLVPAAAAGHRPVVEYLLSKGAEVDAPDAGGATALAYAASGGHIEAVRVLVGRGADSRRKPRDGKSPLFRAAAAGHAPVVEYLLSKGADANDTGHYGETALGNAASRGWTEVVKILVVRGADVRRKGDNLKTPLANAAEGAHKPVVEYLLSKGADPNARDCNGDTALTLAMSRGWKEGMEILARRGADVSAPAREGKAPLLLALERGRTDMADLLVALGARTPGPRLDERVYDYIRTGKADMIARFLVNQCGGLNARAEFGSPLEIAAASGRGDLFDALVARGANVNARYKGGWTALMFASAGGNREVVEFLLAKGADATARNDSGDTAVVLAAAAREGDIVDLLEKRTPREKGKQAGPRPRAVARTRGNGIPAPFTAEAGAAIGKHLDALGKKMRDDAMKNGPPDPVESPTARARAFFDLNRGAYAQAGYDFEATIRAVARDIRKSPMPIKEFLETRLSNANTPFMHIVYFLGFMTVDTRIDCSEFVDPETAEAVEFIRTRLEAIKDQELRRR